MEEMEEGGEIAGACVCDFLSRDHAQEDKSYPKESVKAPQLLSVCIPTASQGREQTSMELRYKRKRCAGHVASVAASPFVEEKRRYEALDLFHSGGGWTCCNTPCVQRSLSCSHVQEIQEILTRESNAPEFFLDDWVNRGHHQDGLIHCHLQQPFIAADPREVPGARGLHFSCMPLSPPPLDSFPAVPVCTPPYLPPLWIGGFKQYTLTQMMDLGTTHIN
jgi:hypothetical protein